MPNSAGLIPVTAVVPVKNEEQNLPNCLAALNQFADVVVVDSNSTDRTCEIATEYGAKVINFDWDGSFPKKRNWVLRSYNFKTEWVLFIDADEVVDPAFCSALSEHIETTNHAGFWLHYTNYFLDRRLKFGVPQRKLACFKIDAGEFERIEEDHWSELDMEIHEHPVLEGTIGEIEQPIDHRDFRGLDRFLQRHIDYAKWEAARFDQMAQSQQLQKTHFTQRQQFKYKNITKFWFAPFYFFYTYIVKLGLLDGVAGYQYASYKKWYFQTVRNLIINK